MRSTAKRAPGLVATAHERGGHGDVWGCRSRSNPMRLMKSSLAAWLTVFTSSTPESVKSTTVRCGFSPTGRPRIRAISCATDIGWASLSGENRRVVARSFSAANGSSGEYARNTATSLAWLASWKCWVPCMNGPGITMVVSIPNWLASYAVTWAKSVQGELRWHVRPEERRNADAGGASDVDEGAGTSLAHVGQRRSVDPMGADHVDVECLRELLGAERLHVAEVEMPGIVDHHVELPRLFEDAFHGSVSRGLRLDVEFNDVQVYRFTPGLLAHLARRLGVVIGERAHAGVDRMSATGQRRGGEVADATSGPSDQDNRQGEAPFNARRADPGVLASVSASRSLAP